MKSRRRGGVGQIASRCERDASVRDVGGNHWYIATRFPGTPATEGLRDIALYLHPRGARRSFRQEVAV